MPTFIRKPLPVESTAVPLAPIMTICQRYVNVEETAAVVKISSRNRHLFI